VLAAALTLLALATGGGVDLAANTWSQIILTVIGAATAAAVLLTARRAPAWGATPLLLFVALAVLTAVSISWSVQPADSWLEANRTLSYLAAFAGAAGIARLYPERWRALLGGVALATTAICAYALLVKVFPATFDRTDVIGRVRAPFDYWNATGLIAALGLPACLWSGARRDRARALRALAAPAVTILLTVLILSYSRSALVAAILGVGFWFAAVPLRLRASAVLAIGGVGAAAAVGWALSTHPFTHDLAALQARTVAGHGFGLVLVLVLALVTACGFAGAFAMDRLQLSADVRRAIGTGLVVLVALVPVAGAVALTASSRGATGEISHIWNTLTSPTSGTGDNPGRLVELGNTRPRYWREGIDVGEHALLKGVGAGAYGTARTRYTHDPLIAGHAHSYVVETFADLGLIGIAVSVALVLAWAVAAGRAVGVRTARRRGRGSSPSPLMPAAPTLMAMYARARRPAASSERLGLLTALSIALIFGLHSAIDWTWFIPGTAVPAMICAGWLVGRGPLAAPVGRVARPAVSRARSPAIGAAILVLAAGTLLGAWTIWQPLRASNADAAAVSALSAGDLKAALEDAHAAASRNPLSPVPLFELAAIDSAGGDEIAARSELVRATTVQPQNPATWETLADYELRHHQPAAALRALTVALRLDHGSYLILQQVAQAARQLEHGAT
jgi:hypothetical protein